jgi:hypothetical protein
MANLGNPRLELVKGAEALARRRIVRFAAAVAFLVAHLLAMRGIAVQRMHLPFDTAPQTAPRFVVADEPLVGPGVPAAWSRLLPSRWDSQHYVSMVLRGYSLCPRQDLRGASLPPLLVKCGFNFYPGYPALGAIVSRVTGLAADWALFAVSIAASLALLYLWTGDAMVERLGLRETWLALLLFNAFTTGFALVTVQTEPLTLLVALASWWFLRRRWLLVGAAVAGLGGALRVTGGAIGLAYGVALLVDAYTRRDEPLSRRVGRVALAAPLCGWGQLALFAYFYAKYKDPLLYVHAHGQAYGHSVSALDALWPSPELAMRALAMGLHEGIFIVTSFVWLGLGLAPALRRFPPVERAYWLANLVVSIGIAMLGSAGLAFAGMNRYWLMALPLFFAMAVALRRRPLALAAWMTFSVWHYWNVDLCVYLAQHDAPSYCHIGYVP